MDKSIELSDESREAAEAFNKLLEAGEVFGDDRTMRRTCDVYLTSDRLAQALGRDVASQSGEEYEEARLYTSWELIYNAKMEFRVSLGNGYCGSGYYDPSAGVCGYSGVVRC
jgi:hypothetical protein